MAIKTLWLDLNIFVSRVSRSTGIFCGAEKVGGGMVGLVTIVALSCCIVISHSP
jgi:hypothetical protein